MRVFFSAGEASGDAYAAALATAIHVLRPSATFEGLGGSRLEAAGAKLHANSSSWGAIGIVESLRIVPRAMAGYYKVKRALGSGEPGLFIPIDFGYANIRLARHAKKLGWKVLYFVPPGSWRRDRQGRDLPAITDAVVTPFPWSAEILRGMGANAHFFGHPLMELIIGASDSAQTAGSPESSAGHRPLLGTEGTTEKAEALPTPPCGGEGAGGRRDAHVPIIGVRREGLAIFPGSRDAEVANNLPVIAEAVRLLGSPKAVIAAAPSVSEARIRELWGPGEIEITRDRYQALRNAQAGIICSGTATLEAALCDCPCVVIYRVGKWAEMEARIVRPRFDHIAMSNILLGRRAFPELIQYEASPQGIANALRPLLDAVSVELSRQLSAMEELREIVGEGQAITRAAELACELMVSP